MVDARCAHTHVYMLKIILGQIDEKESPSSIMLQVGSIKAIVHNLQIILNIY